MRARLVLAVTLLAPAAAAQPTIPPLPVPPVVHRTQPPLPVPPVERGGAPMPQRFYAIAASGQLARQDGWKVCTGGPAMQQMLALGRELAEARKARGEPSTKGCTMKTERVGDGPTVIERTCDKAAGAPYTSHSRSTLVGDRFSTHTELVVPDPAHPGAEKTVVNDMTMTYLGPCPAGLKGGDYLDREGKVHDPYAELTAARARRDAAKPPAP